MLNLPILVFDIETVPDMAAGKRIHGLNLPDDQAALALSNLRRQDLGHDFPRLPFHEIMCISGLWVEAGSLRLFSFSQQNMSEAELIGRFLAIFDKHFPTLVSWNGSGFDLPVLLYRAMLHGLSAAGLLDQGELDQSRRFNNYQNRYQIRHTDLMDRLAMFNNRNFQKLDDVAQLLGLPGKQGQSGHDVSDQVKSGDWEGLCTYCESDVLNTWLIYLRWQLLRGHMDTEGHDEWVQLTRDFLSLQKRHSDGFLRAWQ